MRGWTIARIVLLVLLAAILTGVLILGLSGDFAWDFNFGSFSFYPEEESYSIGNGAVPTDPVDKIDIDWGSGNVIIEAYDGEEIQLSEEITGQAEKRDLMRYRLKNGKLEIKYCAPWRNFFHRQPAKNLTIKLPKAFAKTLEELKVEATSDMMTVTDICARDAELEIVSGEVKLKEAEFKRLKVESVSGQIDGEVVTAEEASFESVSGQIMLNGAFDKLELESVSGKISVNDSIFPQSLKLETISGDADLTIPDGAGFTLKKESISGELFCNFEVTYSGDTVIYGDGRADYKTETVSGDVRLNRE